MIFTNKCAGQTSGETVGGDPGWERYRREDGGGAEGDEVGHFIYINLNIIIFI